MESLKPTVDAFMTGDKKAAAAALSKAVAALEGYEAEYGAYYLKVVTKVTDKGDAFIKTVREDGVSRLAEEMAPPQLLRCTPTCAWVTLVPTCASSHLHLVERNRATKRGQFLLQARFAGAHGPLRSALSIRAADRHTLGASFGQRTGQRARKRRPAGGAGFHLTRSTEKPHLLFLTGVRALVCMAGVRAAAAYDRERLAARGEGGGVQAALRGAARVFAGSAGGPRGRGGRGGACGAVGTSRVQLRHAACI